MKFEEALELVIEKKEALGPSFKESAVFDTVEEIRTAAAIWNVIALALAEKGLDDFIVIDRNNNMTSIPLKGKTDVQGKDKKDKKDEKKSPKSDKKEKGLVNEQEEPEEKPAESSEQ